MRKQQQLQRLAIALLAGSTLTAWQLDRTAHAAVKPTHVTGQHDNQKHVNVIFKRDGSPFAEFVIKGAPGEMASLHAEEIRRDYLCPKGDRWERIPAKLPIPADGEPIVLNVVPRTEKRAVTKDVDLTVVHYDMDGNPIANCPDEHYHYQVTTTYIHDRYGKQDNDIKYKLSGVDVTSVVPQAISGYQLDMPGIIVLTPDGLIRDPEKRLVFLHDKTPLKLTIRASYRQLKDKHGQRDQQEDSTKDREKQEEDQQPGGSGVEEDQPTGEESSKGQQEDKQEPSTDQPTDAPDDPSKERPTDDSSADSQPGKDPQEPSTDNPTDVPADKIDDQPSEKDSSKEQQGKNEQEPSTDRPADKTDEKSKGQATDVDSSKGTQKPSMDQPVDTDDGPEDQPTDDQQDKDSEEHSADESEETPAGREEGQPTDEDSQDNQGKEDEQNSSADQPVDNPADEAKDRPTDGDTPKDHQGEDPQGPSNDQSVDVPDDKVEDQPADSQGQQAGETQEGSDKGRPAIPADDQEKTKHEPSTLPDHQGNNPSEPSDQKQPSSPLTSTKPGSGQEDDKPGVPSEKVNHQPSSTDNATDISTDEKERSKDKTDQSVPVKNGKNTDSNIDDEQAKIKELDRQAPPQSADDRLPQTGDNDQGRLVAAISGLLTGLVGLGGSIFAWKKN